MSSLERQHITGLVLAGGLGRRMGGVDKGLQLLNGQPLVQHALQRLAPQVGPLAVNANRHRADYAAFGVPVWPDTAAGHPGPLAGWLAGLQRCSTPWLATVPCDTPGFPADLVARLATALQTAGADLAVATLHHADGTARMQPVFALLHQRLAPALEQALRAGQHKVGQWVATQHHVLAPFSDEAAFFNANTPGELQQLQDGTMPRT